MNEKEAREIMKNHFDVLTRTKPSPALVSCWCGECMYAKGLLAGLEDERERAKPLVEALAGLIKEIETAESMDCHLWYEGAVESLAAYEAMVDSPPSTINHENREKP